jgi:hypothetical protein
MRQFTIKFTSSDKLPFTVDEGKLDSTSTALAICGHGYPNYGEMLWTNLVHLLENYASPTPPIATTGQLWYNTDEKSLRIYNGDEYVYVEGSPSGVLTVDNLVDKLTYVGEDYADYTFPYFDIKYINKSGDGGIGQLVFADDADIVMGANGGIKVKKSPMDLEDVVTLGYFAQTMLDLGYDIGTGTGGGSSAYLALTGGTMKDAALVKFGKTGGIQIQQTATGDYDVTNKLFCDMNYLSFKGPNNHVGSILMDGVITLYADLCDVTTDDSYDAVCAKWVIDRIKFYTKDIAPSDATGFIPIEDTGTTVKNTLTFDTNFYVKLKSVDDTSPTDLTSAINIDYANNHYVKKTGDTLTVHPASTITSTDAKDVPTCGWVNSRIQTALTGYNPQTPTTPDTSGAGSTGLTGTLDPKGYQIFSSGFMIQWGWEPDPNIGEAVPAPITFAKSFQANGLLNWQASLVAPTLGAAAKGSSGIDIGIQLCDKITNTVGEITGVKYYQQHYSNSHDNYAGFYWVAFGKALAKDIPAPAAIGTIANTTPTDTTPTTPAATGITAGPSSYGATYIDYGNGMVKICGMAKSSVPAATGSLMLTGADIAFPNNMKLKIPYKVEAVVMDPPGTSQWDLTSDSQYVPTMTNSGCRVNFLVAIASGTYTAALKTYWATPRDIYWEINGFKE